VGVHTSGAIPAALARVLPLVDCVGLDIKGPARPYAEIVRTGGPAAEREPGPLKLVPEAGAAHQIGATFDPTVITDGGDKELTQRCKGWACVTTFSRPCAPRVRRWSSRVIWGRRREQASRSQQGSDPTRQPWHSDAQT
jgi:hypothetical protein